MTSLLSFGFVLESPQPHANHIYRMIKVSFGIDFEGAGAFEKLATEDMPLLEGEEKNADCKKKDD